MQDITNKKTKTKTNVQSISTKLFFYKARELKNTNISSDKFNYLTKEQDM